MRRKELRGNIFAVKLTVDNLELVERVCGGSIKGTMLPREKRGIDFYYSNQEHRIEIGQWYVEIRTGIYTMKTVWDNVSAKELLKDIDDVTF